MVFVHLVAAVGLLLAWQGWKARTVNVDLVPHIESAHELLVSGHLPDRGCLNGFASFIPPGTTWLLLPGLFVFTDPRLFEVIGSGLLYLGTLIGILLLASDYLGIRCGWLAVGLYGLSEIGLQFAGSLWPRGHAFFYVWMIYCTGRWIRCGPATYLMAALVSWAAGMYVFLELAPAVFILPMLWLVYRPPVQLWAVIGAAGVSLAIWSPYLAFEVGRGFVDLRAQMLQQEILPAHYQQSWCDPMLAMGSWSIPAQVPHVPEHTWDALWSRLLLQGKAVVWGIPYNVERVARVPGPSVVLLLLASSLVMLSRSAASADMGHYVRHAWRLPLVLGLLLGGTLANEVVVARLLDIDVQDLPLSIREQLRVVQVGIGLGGLVLVPRSRKRGVTSSGPPHGLEMPNERPAPQARMLVWSLVVPWVILLCLAEPNPYPLGGERRFWWLWPLQVIMVAAWVTHGLPRWRVPRAVVWIIYTGLIVIVCGNPVALSQLEAWLRTGWAGPDGAEIQAVDAAAAHMRAQGKTHAAIGYQTLYLDQPAVHFFMAAFHIVDPHYKVGADFDLLFKFRHGIANMNRCAEGISPRDEYRIVQRSAWWTRPEDVAVSSGSSFQGLASFGPYHVFTRQ